MLISYWLSCKGVVRPSPHVEVKLLLLANKAQSTAVLKANTTQAIDQIQPDL